MRALLARESSRSGRLLLASSLVALLWSVNAQASTIPPIWETNLGNAAAFAPNADEGTVVINFGFAFPFLGNNYTTASLSTNGFLWLNAANTDPGCCDGSVAALLAGDPRIAGGWFDLNASTTGSIRVNTFGGNRAVITYVGVPECCDVGSYTFQMQLLSTGRIVFGYDSFQTPANSSDILIGVTPGNNAADPGSSDLLNGTPFTSGGGTVYQFIGAVGIEALNTFEGSNVIFDPNGSGWSVSRQTTGTGPAAPVPEPGTFGMLGLGAAALLELARRRRVRPRP